MDFTMVIPVLIAFVLSVAAGPVVIPVLRRLKMDQTEREDGVKSHLKKAGTPTMGGVMILFAIAVTSLIYVREYPKVIPVLFVTIGFGLVGFLDDYLKVVLHRSDGLMPMQKMALQIVITAIFAFYIVKVAKIPLTMLIPFSGGKYLDIGWFAIPVLFIAVIGTVNGVNFTDGLDGLASSVTVLVATFFTVVAIGTKSGIEPITCAVVGALLGFLLFNVYPASVFMGDTGSLILHVPGIHLDLEVVIAGGIVALRNLVDGLHGIHELLNQIVGVLLQSDIAEHNHVVSHLVMIYYRSISLDVSLTLQSLLPFEGGRRGEVYSCGKFLHCES